MKRSEINKAVVEAITFFKLMQFPLPEYAMWSPDDWATKGSELQEVLDLGLGWDVTDFGSGDLAKVGRTIFTLRNGRGNDDYPKTYAHKIMHMPEGQKSIVHYHRTKMEDIFNQGGGNILIAFWAIGEDGSPSSEMLELSVSGRKTRVLAGSPVHLSPGNWVCVPPRTYHQFWSEEGGGTVLSAEISSVCNDYSDNIFWPDGERFPTIQEDEAARYVLCHEYISVREGTVQQADGSGRINLSTHS